MSHITTRLDAGHLLRPATTFAVVCLFCLLGLAVTAAIAPHLDLGWVMSHIE